MIETKILELLKNKNNLLAFSAGGDSTALFFLLLKHKIPFDIAIVDYALREQSKQEVAYARELAKKHSLGCHLLEACKITKNFEANARKIRYDFFEQLIDTHKYDNLLTAHHLGDRLEWMLMQFCKGAGSLELSGMQKIEKRSNYTLLRPLLHLGKEDLLDYLQEHSLKYFHDESNNDENLQRNYFRHNYAEPLLREYKNGIQKSFEYIDEDNKQLLKEVDLNTFKELAYFQNTQNIRSNIYAVDKHLKSLGYMMSAHERELLKHNSVGVLGRKHLIVQREDYIFMTPFITTKQPMPKKFKEECRVLKIEPKLRAYLFEHPDVFEKIKELLHHP